MERRGLIVDDFLGQLPEVAGNTHAEEHHQHMHDQDGTDDGHVEQVSGLEGVVAEDVPVGLVVEGVRLLHVVMRVVEHQVIVAQPRFVSQVRERIARVLYPRVLLREAVHRQELFALGISLGYFSVGRPARLVVEGHFVVMAVVVVVSSRKESSSLEVEGPEWAAY